MISQTDIDTLMEEFPPQLQEKPAANHVQVAGTHYKRYGDIQPWDAIVAWQMGYLEGTAVKYLVRWKDKNGIEDLHKAAHYIQKAIEVYSK